MRLFLKSLPFFLYIILTTSLYPSFTSYSSILFLSISFFFTLFLTYSPPQYLISCLTMAYENPFLFRSHLFLIINEPTQQNENTMYNIPNLRYSLLLTERLKTGIRDNTSGHHRAQSQLGFG